MRFEEALPHFQTAIACEPALAEAHVARGECLRWLGRFAAAEQALRQAIEFEPDLATAKYELAETLRVLGRIEEAITWYQQAIAQLPNYVLAHFGLGCADLASARWSLALGALDRAIELHTGFAEAWAVRGNALAELGQIEDAERSYRQGMSMPPRSHPQVELFLGKLLLDQNRTQEALELLEISLRRSPTCLDSHALLAQALRALGRDEEAQVVRRRAQALATLEREPVAG